MTVSSRQLGRPCWWITTREPAGSPHSAYDRKRPFGNRTRAQLVMMVDGAAGSMARTLLPAASAAGPKRKPRRVSMAVIRHRPTSGRDATKKADTAGAASARGRQCRQDPYQLADAR